ncbi:hypothetical protein ES707_07099 [subsurface metagenome]
MNIKPNIVLVTVKPIIPNHSEYELIDWPTNNAVTLKNASSK